MGGWAGGLTAGSLRGLCQLMSIPSPGRKGEVIYILQEEGATAVTFLTRRPGGQRAEEGTGGLFSWSGCSIGSRSPGGAVPCWLDYGGTCLPFPLLLSLLHHLPAHPGAAARQPLALGARVPILQLGSRWLLAACASSPHALCPPSSVSPSGVLAGRLSEEAEAFGEKHVAALLPLSRLRKAASQTV